METAKAQRYEGHKGKSFLWFARLRLQCRVSKMIYYVAFLHAPHNNGDYSQGEESRLNTELFAYFDLANAVSCIGTKGGTGDMIWET